MPQRILYPTEEGGVAVIIPSEDAGMTVMEIALKDVPTGVPFKIVDASEVPTDREERNLWTIDPAICTDGVGS